MLNQPTIVFGKADVSLFQAADGASRCPSLVLLSQRRAAPKLTHPLGGRTTYVVGLGALFSGGHLGKRFELEPGLRLVGRSPDVDIAIDSPGLSRKHAQLRVHGELAWVLDLGSANGTHVNGDRVDAERALVEGDLIRLGIVVLKFHAPASVDAVMHERLYSLATLDSLTGVANRRHFMDLLQEGIVQARGATRALSLLCCDLDHFKTVNDQFGHQAGDFVLQACVAALRSALRPGDVIGRIGGEEFAVLLPDTRPHAAAQIAERVRNAVALHGITLVPNLNAGAQRARHQQTVSIGVAMLSPDMDDGADLIQLADRRLYAAKNGGRNRVCTTG